MELPLEEENKLFDIDDNELLELSVGLSDIRRSIVLYNKPSKIEDVNEEDNEEDNEDEDEDDNADAKEVTLAG